MSGPSGCGKTHLAAAVANRCIEDGVPALFLFVPDLLDHLRATYQTDSDLGYDELFEQVRSSPILILDDLGAQTASSWAQEKLFQLINHRFNAQMPTVYTTALDVEALEPRLQTRLCDPSLSKVFSLEVSHRREAASIDSLNQPLLGSMDFKNFDPRRLAVEPQEIKLIEHAYRQALKFAEEPKDWLVLVGRSGRGKTRLAAAIGNYRREKGQSVLFVIVPDLLDHLRSSFHPQSPATYDNIFEEVRSAPLLILDDLGAHTTTPWADEKLLQLINYRYNACLPTVITSSLNIKGFEARLASRLTDPQVSNILLLGEFDFWGKGQQEQRRGRGRPPRR